MAKGKKLSPSGYITIDLGWIDLTNTVDLDELELTDDVIALKEFINESREKIKKGTTPRPLLLTIGDSDGNYKYSGFCTYYDTVQDDGVFLWMLFIPKDFITISCSITNNVVNIEHIIEE